MNIVGQVISSWSRMVNAARHDPRKRKFVDAQLADTRLDVSSSSRQSIAALSRWLCYNSAIVRGAIDTMTRNAIGPGIKCQARTPDEGWNRATEQWLAMWEGSCDVRGTLSYAAMQQVATRTMLRDNEIFILLTDNGDGFPQLQLVEGHRCETPSYIKNDPKIFDGVRMNKFGRPLSYYIRTGLEGDSFAEVQATDLILLAERDRADEVRSLSKLASCINLLLDRDEILDYEMLACKRAGQIGLAVESTTNSGPGFFNPTETDETNLTTDKIFGGGALVNMPIGKTLREIKNDRPSQNLQQHMDQYIRAVASGLGVPYAYIWSPNELTGPSQRFVLAQAQRRFDEISDTLIEQMLKRVRKWALAKAIKRGDLTPPRGMTLWWEAVYHTPARTTIDAGRDSAADREDLKLGIKTLADISAERGSDWVEIVNQKIAEQVYIKTKAEEAGLQASDVQFIPQQGKPAVAPAQPAPQTPPTADLPEDATVQPELEAAEDPIELTETYAMKDEPDLCLNEAELDMVAKAIGVGIKKKENFELAKPSDGMVEEAKRGLAWRKEYNRGGTAVGVARARDIINRVDFPDDTIGRISSYLARHEVDKKGEGFSPGEPGYPSAGRIAWALWGGDAGVSWAARQMKRIRSELRTVSQTPAPKRDRIKGSDENKPGSAASRSTGGGIEINEATEKALKNKIAGFKKRHPSRKAPSLGTLKKVYRRGAGAFSTSHRPGMSRGGWAIARVNKFLTMAGGGSVKKSYRDADGDLL